VVRVSARKFAPVFLPEGRVPRDRMSATFGRAFNVCPRAAFLYQLHKGGASTHPMERGSALHRVLELATVAAIERGEPRIPPEVVKAIVNEVLADPAYWTPFEEHDYIRESCYRWAEETEIIPEQVVAVETLFVLAVDGFEVRCKIDLAELVDGGKTCRVRDYKSSRSLPSFEDIGRKRPDGSIAAKDYQLVLYGLALAFGTPIRFEACAICGGRGFGMKNLCPNCSGRGVVEVLEPFGVATLAQQFELSYVYPGIKTSDGTMAHRDVSLTRLELHEYMDSLRAQVAQVRHSVDTGDWPASYGSHCVECPASSECPIPVELRKHAGTINTVEQAAEAAEQLAREKDEHAARRKELIAFVKALPEGERRLRYGRDQVLYVGYEEKTTIPDREAMWDAVDRALRGEEPFDRSRFVRKSNSTPIKDGRLSEEELAAEAAERGEAA
jgi:hypothetical protein